MSEFFKSAKALVLATVVGVLVLLQFTLLTAALDFITSIALVAIGFLAGRMSK